jgi:phage tail tape-measure protein
MQHSFALTQSGVSAAGPTAHFDRLVIEAGAGAARVYLRVIN